VTTRTSPATQFRGNPAPPDPPTILVRMTDESFSGSTRPFPSVRRIRHRLVAAALAIAIGCILLGSCSASAALPVQACPSAVNATAATPTTNRSGTKPHIMVIVMENQGYDQIMCNTDAPYINSLANSYLRATDSYARGHYSLPNYLEMISGQAYEASGTANDCTPSSCGPITGTNVTDQLNAAGIRWLAVMGAMPSDCDTNNAGGIGGYGVRHDPFVYFPQGRKSPSCGYDVPAGNLMTALSSSMPPDFLFYSPSICEDGGGDAPCSTIANGDHFLAALIPAIMATRWYRDGGTIILTWDEGASGDSSGRYGDTGGHILTIVISARTKGDRPDPGYVDSAGILRTIERAYGLSFLGDAANPHSGTLPLGTN